MNWFYNMKTLWKLVSGFGVVCAITAFVGWTGVSKTAAVNELLNNMYEREVIGISECKEANINLLYISRATRNALLAADPAEVKPIAEEMNGYFNAFQQCVQAAEPTIYTAEGKEVLQRIVSTIPEYKREIERTLKLCLEGNSSGGRSVLQAAAPLAAKVDADMTKLAEFKVGRAQQAYKESDAVYSRASIMIIGFSIGGSLLGMCIGVFIARVIASPMNAAVVMLRRVADGDFTARLNVHTTDEIGQMAKALNNTVESVQLALQETRVVADGVATAAQQLSSASEEISSGAQEQASGLEETASSLEEITSTVKQNADNAQQANQLAASARDIAEKGGRIVGEAVQGMGEINASSKKIADIITTIDEIAFQTNLLALNAAVEAARAGEQGRGFAVVAGEVRNLAQRSAGAAKEIKILIQDSVQKVSTGSDLVNQSGDALDQIVTSVKRVTDIVSEIAAASREQTRGIEQVNQAVTQMDTVTQSNASQTEELSSTAESLAGQAEQLQGLVARFKLEDNQRSSEPAMATAKESTERGAKRQSSSKAVAAKSPSRSDKADFSFDDEEGGELVGAGASSGQGFDGFEEF